MTKRPPEAVDALMARLVEQKARGEVASPLDRARLALAGMQSGLGECENARAILAGVSGDDKYRKAIKRTANNSPTGGSED